MHHVQHALRLGAKAYELTCARLEQARANEDLAHLSVLYNQLAKLSDKHTFESADFDPPHDCKMGCAYCCHLNVGVTLPELYEVWEGLSEGDKARLLKLYEQTAPFSRDEARCREKIPCVFLDQGEPGRGRCSIYSRRPFACRGMFGLSASHCQNEWGKPAAQMPAPAVPRLGIHALGVAVMGACLEMRFQPYVVNLDSALWILLKEPKPEQVFLRWLSGEMVLAKARQAKPPSPKHVREICETMRELGE